MCRCVFQRYSHNTMERGWKSKGKEMLYHSNGQVLHALICHSFLLLAGAFLIAQLVKNPPAVQETLVWFLFLEDPLEKGTATHSSILAWRIPWAIQSMGLQRVGHNWATFTFTHFRCLLPKGFVAVIVFKIPDFSYFFQVCNLKCPF